MLGPVPHGYRQTTNEESTIDPVIIPGIFRNEVVEKVYFPLETSTRMSSEVESTKRCRSYCHPLPSVFNLSLCLSRNRYIRTCTAKSSNIIKQYVTKRGQLKCIVCRKSD